MGEGGIRLSRRNLLRAAGGAATGTALGGLLGVGADLGPATARAQELRIQEAKTTPSVCPYCSVGYATLVHTIAGKIVNIEGDPRSPVNEGTLCPKGAAIYQLHINPNRPTQVLHVILASALLLVYLAGEHALFQRFTPVAVIHAAESLGVGGYVVMGMGGVLIGASFLQNMVPLGQTGRIYAGGMIPLVNLAVALAVTAGFVLLLADFIEQTLVLRLRRKR